MKSDKILLIPYLSKELNLIGHKPLPFKLKQHIMKQKLSLDDEDWSDSDLKTETPVKIIFDKTKMINQLVSVTIELVSRIKKYVSVDSNDVEDKLRFEINKLEKQLNSTKKNQNKLFDELAKEKEKNRQLQEKLCNLEEKLKNYCTETKQIKQKQINSERLLKCNLRKQESNLKELHAIIWKQFNLLDKNYFPENFEIVKTNQLNFSKLWSDIRYSRPTTRENALKKAVCLFQENNSLLMEDVYFLKNLLLITLEEVNGFIKDMSVKMHLCDKASFPLSYKVEELFDNSLDLDVKTYKKFIEEHLSFIRKFFKDFEEVSFTVDDQLFVCWSDLIKNNN